MAAVNLSCDAAYTLAVAVGCEYDPFSMLEEGILLRIQAIPPVQAEWPNVVWGIAINEVDHVQKIVESGSHGPLANVEHDVALRMRRATRQLGPKGARRHHKL